MKGILFDFDGTLADTIGKHAKAWVDALAETGIAICAADYCVLEGRSMREVAQILSGGRCDTERLIQRKKALLAAGEVAFYPGALDLIAKLRGRVPIGVVTSSHRDQLDRVVSPAFLVQFDAIVTGDQFAIGKPHPAPYLAGAKAIGIPPAACIAVENAPLGVQSAKAAGMHCIGICSTVSAEQLSEAHQVLATFAELEPVIRLLL